MNAALLPDTILAPNYSAATPAVYTIRVERQLYRTAGRRGATHVVWWVCGDSASSPLPAFCGVILARPRRVDQAGDAPTCPGCQRSVRWLASLDARARRKGAREQ